MGKKDDYQYDYLDNCERFADQVNGALFGGRQVVKPDELEPADVAGGLSWNGIGQAGGLQDHCG